MMQTFLFSGLVFASFLFISCSDMSTDEGALKVGNEYLPLSVGNQWIFKSGGNSPISIVQTVVATKQIGNYTYAVMVSKMVGQTFGDTAYYRIDSQGKVFVNRGGEEFLFADFSKDKNESWQSYGSYIARISQKGISVETPIGTFPNCVEIMFDIERAADDEHSFTFSPGFGFVKMRSAWFNFDLVSITIDGKTLNFSS